MARYGMVIDLKRCYGCYSCAMACKQANRTPPGVFWSRVLRGEMGVFPNSVRQALPVLCNQCEEPDCMKVCPTGATYQTDDGIVRVDQEQMHRLQILHDGLPLRRTVFGAGVEELFPGGLASQRL